MSNGERSHNFTPDRTPGATFARGLPEQAEQFLKRGIKTVPMDLDELSTYEDALQGVQRLFMVTGYTVDMLNQGKNLTDAAKDVGVEYIVHVGTFHQPGRPQAKLIRHYIWHQLIETYIEASGIGWTHLCPNAFMQNFFGAVQDDKLRMFFGQERVGLVDCFDLARVAAAALREPAKHSGQRYFLSVEALTIVGGRLIDWDQIRIEDNRETLQLLC
jgi:NAD(P)H dehydrogenase (quinone)